MILLDNFAKGVYAKTLFYLAQTQPDVDFWANTQIEMMDRFAGTSIIHFPLSYRTRSVFSAFREKNLLTNIRVTDGRRISIESPTTNYLGQLVDGILVPPDYSDYADPIGKDTSKYLVDEDIIRGLTKAVIEAQPYDFYHRFRPVRDISDDL
ncbi:MAG TPA: hypothetical protein VK158_03675 [Acidobacteriota bacterium]|nr:hypothetical protein [Acidobacteriota bacterium]